MFFFSLSGINLEHIIFSHVQGLRLLDFSRYLPPFLGIKFVFSSFSTLEGRETTETYEILPG